MLTAKRLAEGRFEIQISTAFGLRTGRQQITILGHANTLPWRFVPGFLGLSEDAGAATDGFLQQHFD